ncbi:hypothetical protein RZS08_22155, partial [Arthrospira platensis SPKY1]|nr:hypothetical protein [Arthrospira platensis SPKY1]
MMNEGSAIPWVLAGPILRQCVPTRLVCWLAVREPARVRVRIAPDEGALREQVLLPGTLGCRMLNAGQHLYYLLIDLRFDEPLPQDRWISYSVALQGLTAADDVWFESEDWAPELCYPGRS